MTIETKGRGIELILRSLPYPDQVKNIDLERDGAIYFDWRSDTYKLELSSCRIDRYNNGLLEGSDSAILMTHLMKINSL